MMMNEEIKNRSTARLSALGRKASRDLTFGDKFTYRGETGTFLGWHGPEFPSSGAPYRMATVATADMANGVRWSLNMAGSVEVH